MYFKAIYFLLLTIIIFHFLLFIYPENLHAFDTYNHIKKFESKIEPTLSIGLPINWISEEYYRNGVHVISFIHSNTDDYFTENVKITIEDIKPNTSLNEYSKIAKENLKTNLKKFNLIDSYEITLLDHLAERILYTHESGGKTIIMLQIWTIIDDKFIVFSFGSTPSKYSTFIPIINEMLDSINIKNIKKIEANFNFPVNMSQYKDVSTKFEVNYSSAWSINKTEHRVSFISNQENYSDPHLERIDIFEFEFIPNNTFVSPNELLTNLFIKELDYLDNRFNNFALLYAKPIVIDGKNAFEYSYKYDSVIKNTKTIEILTFNNNLLYIISFTGHEYDVNRAQDYFDMIIASFQFN